MNPNDFRSDQAGKAVKTQAGNWAFVPAPLPPFIEYDAATALLLSQADSSLSELSGLGLLGSIAQMRIGGLTLQTFAPFLGSTGQ